MKHSSRGEDSRVARGKARRLGVKREGGRTDTTDMTVTMPDEAVLARMLDAASLRHRAISQNIANVNTPGYRRKEVEFEEALAERLRSGSAEPIKPKVVEVPSPAQRPDGNGVTLEQEMMDLNKNALLHNAATQLLASQLAKLRSAITGR